MRRHPPPGARLVARRQDRRHQEAKAPRGRDRQRPRATRRRPPRGRRARTGYFQQASRWRQEDRLGTQSPLRPRRRFGSQDQPGAFLLREGRQEAGADIVWPGERGSAPGGEQPQVWAVSPSAAAAATPAALPARDRAAHPIRSGGTPPAAALPREPRAAPAPPPPAVATAARASSARCR